MDVILVNGIVVDKSKVVAGVFNTIKSTGAKILSNFRNFTNDKDNGEPSFISKNDFIIYSNTYQSKNNLKFRSYVPLNSLIDNKNDFLPRIMETSELVNSDKNELKDFDKIEEYLEMEISAENDRQNVYHSDYKSNKKWDKDDASFDPYESLTHAIFKNISRSNDLNSFKKPSSDIKNEIDALIGEAGGADKFTFDIKNGMILNKDAQLAIGLKRKGNEVKIVFSHFQNDAQEKNDAIMPKGSYEIAHLFLNLIDKLSERRIKNKQKSRSSQDNFKLNIELLGHDTSSGLAAFAAIKNKESKSTSVNEFKAITFNSGDYKFDPHKKIKKLKLANKSKKIKDIQINNYTFKKNSHKTYKSIGNTALWIKVNNNYQSNDDESQKVVFSNLLSTYNKKDDSSIEGQNQSSLCDCYEYSMESSQLNDDGDSSFSSSSSSSSSSSFSFCTEKGSASGENDQDGVVSGRDKATWRSPKCSDYYSQQYHPYKEISTAF